MPTKSTAKATEIGLSVPTASAANPPEMSRPAISVPMIAPTSRIARSASSSQRQSSVIDRPAENPAPSDSEASCSSESATSPVIRTVTPRSGVSPSALASARM